MEPPIVNFPLSFHQEYPLTSQTCYFLLNKIDRTASIKTPPVVTMCSSFDHYKLIYVKIYKN